MKWPWTRKTKKEPTGPEQADVLCFPHLLKHPLLHILPTDETFQNQNLTKPEQLKLRNDCREMMRFQSLNKVLKHLKCSQRDKIAHVALTEHDRDAIVNKVLYAQGVLEGIESVSRQIEVLAGKEQVKEEFDPNQII